MGDGWISCSVAKDLCSVACSVLGRLLRFKAYCCAVVDAAPDIGRAGQGRPCCEINIARILMLFSMQTVVERHCCFGNLFIVVMFFPLW